ncbi:MAG: VanZ family protein [Erysipelotrichia bacterium]|nr:VanZ family protein [Erysipelotrichia bacterium]
MKKTNLMKYVLFILYIFILIDLLLLAREVDMEVGVNIIPFYSFKMFIPLLKSGYQSYRYLAISNLFGNILIFIPMGIFLPLIFKRNNNFLYLLINTFLISLSIEVIQYYTKLGTADVDDIILNVLGSVLGFAIYKIWKRGRKDEYFN